MKRKKRLEKGIGSIDEEIKIHEEKRKKATSEFVRMFILLLTGTSDKIGLLTRGVCVWQNYDGIL